MRPRGDVETAFTPIANNINRLVDTVALNYMALHGQRSEFFSRVAGCSLSNSAAMNWLTALCPSATAAVINPPISGGQGVRATVLSVRFRHLLTYRGASWPG